MDSFSMANTVNIAKQIVSVLPREDAIHVS